MKNINFDSVAALSNRLSDVCRDTINLVTACGENGLLSKQVIFGDINESGAGFSVSSNDPAICAANKFAESIRAVDGYASIFTMNETVIRSRALTLWAIACSVAEGQGFHYEIDQVFRGVDATRCDRILTLNYEDIVETARMLAQHLVFPFGFDVDTRNEALSIEGAPVLNVIKLHGAIDYLAKVNTTIAIMLESVTSQSFVSHVRVNFTHPAERAETPVTAHGAADGKSLNAVIETEPTPEQLAKLKSLIEGAEPIRGEQGTDVKVIDGYMSDAVLDKVAKRVQVRLSPSAAEGVGLDTIEPKEIFQQIEEATGLVFGYDNTVSNVVESLTKQACNKVWLDLHKITMLRPVVKNFPIISKHSTVQARRQIEKCLEALITKFN